MSPLCLGCHSVTFKEMTKYVCDGILSALHKTNRRKMAGVFYRPRVSLKYWTTRVVERFLWDLTLTMRACKNTTTFFIQYVRLVDSSCHYDKDQRNPSVDMWKLSTKTKLLKQHYWQIFSILYQTHLSSPNLKWKTTTFFFFFFFFHRISDLQFY